MEPELDVGLVRGRARASRAVHLLLEVMPLAHPAPGRRRVARQVEAMDVPVRVRVRDAHRVRRLLGLCFFCFCDFLVGFVRIRSFATPSSRTPSPRLEEEDAETRGQNDDALARRLELADARADEGGNIAFFRVLAERSLGPVRKLGALSPFSTRTR